MEITAADAAEILRQIEQNQWKWLKVKRFDPAQAASVEEKYAALEVHHRDETGRMIEVITALCRALAASQNAKT
jgi:hypothetical protein